MDEVRDDVGRAAALLLASSFLFAAMGVLVKVAHRGLPFEEIVLFRNVLGLAVLAPWIAAAGRDAWATPRVRLQVVRGLAGLLAMFCFFRTIGRLPLADALLLNYTMPLFIPFFARWWLDERMTRGLWAALGVGFVGVVFMIRPTPGLFRPDAIVGLGAGFFAALAMVSIRRLSSTEPPLRTVVWFGLVGALASAPVAVPRWRWPSPGEWAVLAGVAALASTAQILLTRGYTAAPATRAGPFVYSAVVFGGIFDWLVWGHVPDALSIAGACLIAAGGAMVIRGGAPLDEAGRPPRGT